MTHALTFTALLAGGFLLAAGAHAQGAGTITDNTVETIDRPITEDVATDPRIAAERFLEHVNYARVALAMKNASLAQEHLDQARRMLTVLKSASTDMRRVARVESGRIVYEYDTERKYHYFPIRTGPVEVKEIKAGPFWAKKGMAVTDAEIVYLSLDLTDDKAERQLAKADQSLREGKLKDAEKELADLTYDVVKTDEKIEMPVEKARDNIALARQFVAMGNYDGARYSLKHADKALSELEKDALYSDRRQAIANMRQEVAALQTTIAANDPTVLEKADTKLREWWNNLKEWADSKS